MVGTNNVGSWNDHWLNMGHPHVDEAGSRYAGESIRIFSPSPSRGQMWSLKHNTKGPWYIAPPSYKLVYKPQLP